MVACWISFACKGVLFFRMARAVPIGFLFRNIIFSRLLACRLQLLDCGGAKFFRVGSLMSCMRFTYVELHV
jgi:hypothetical protein